MKKALTVGFLLLLPAAASAADKSQDMLTKMDKDKDGMISQQEYLDSKTNMFQQHDKNKDGKLDKNELKEHGEHAAREAAKDYGRGQMRQSMGGSTQSSSDLDSSDLDSSDLDSSDLDSSDQTGGSLGGSTAR